jgi:hypothetical protein
MEEWRNEERASGYANLGPLPEVVESNSETTWQTFLQLQAQQGAAFSKTVPSTLAGLHGAMPQQSAGLTMDDVMVEARRFNRICPTEQNWVRLCVMLHDAVGVEPPAAICGVEARSTPKLTKRIRMRDQVEWAAQNGTLPLLANFLAGLGEDQWVHMG